MSAREETTDRAERGGVRAWVRRVILVAKIRIVRQYRSTLEQPWIAFLQIFAVLFGVVLVVGRLPIAGYESLWNQPGAYVFGRRLATDGAAIVSTVRGFAGVLFVLMVFLTVLKESTDGTLDSNADNLLLATDVETVAAGELLWSTIFAGWQFGIPLLGAAVAFGAGTRSVLSGIAVGVAGVLLVGTAVPVGYVAALAVRLGFQELPTLAENKVLFGAPLAVVYFALFVRARQSIDLLATVPLGWFGDLGLLASPAAGADPLHAVAVLVGAPLGVVGLTAGAARLGERSWYGDPPRESETTEEQVPDAVDRLLGRLVSRPTAAVARTVWIRLLRQPRVLVFAAMPIALTASLGVEIASLRPSALPVVVAVYGATAVGMGATLNPLGNVGRGLQATLTVQGGGRALVHGYVVSAALPGIPAIVAATLFAGTAVGLGPVSLLAVVLVGAIFPVAAATVSMGIGVALPNYDSLRATSESGVRPPRLWATTVFLVVMVAVGVPALVGVGWAPVVAATIGLSVPAATAVGVVLTAITAGSVSLVAYRYALARIVNYRIE